MLRPCRFPDDLCITGVNPICTPRKFIQKSRSFRKHTNYVIATVKTIPVIPTTTTTPLLPSTKLPEDIDPDEPIISSQGLIRSTRLPATVVESDPADPDADADLNALATLPPSPVFRGSLTWDGKADRTKPPCFLNHVINEEINGPNSAEEKEQWLKDHEADICDFTRLQVCVDLEIGNNNTDNSDSSDYQGGGEGGQEDEMGVCRCLESSYVLVERKCHIPAGLDSRSDCGSTKVYLPVPSPSGGRPSVTTTCVPNAECVASREYFGKRCRCLRWATHNRADNTCAAHTLEITKSLAVIILIINFYMVLCTMT